MGLNPQKGNMELDKLFTDSEIDAFNVFADIYPIEAYRENPKKFCNYVRTKNHNITDEHIEAIIKDEESKDEPKADI